MNFTETRLVTGLAEPTSMALAEDGRIFVTEQGGKVRVLKNGALLTTPFVSLDVHREGEAGLLGLAFDPDFASNQWVYVYYTTTASGLHNRVSRFKADGDVAVPGSEQVLFELDALANAFNHNGGALHFGLDNKLYVAVGDNATPTNAQSLDNLLGKMLRINPDGSIPSDNPFYDTASGRNRAIWAYGLRNPFTFAMQPGTGKMFVNDVGQDTYEEINEGLRGANYGWPATEGPTDDPRFKTPHFYYGQSVGCAITGGTFYNPERPLFPSDYLGDYFYADYCGGFIRKMEAGTSTTSKFITDVDAAIDLDVAEDGNLYYLERGFGATTGKIFKVSYNTSKSPTVTQQPADRSLPENRNATFSVSAAGEAPLRFQWQRNGVDVAGATGTSLTLSNVQLSDDGARIRVIVSNDFGSVTSREARLTVTANKPPVAAITSPGAALKFTAGTTISFTGTGTDAEDGNLGAWAFTWRVDYHTGTAPPRPFVAETNGIASGSFSIPTTTPYTEPDVFYRIHLTIQDSHGLTSSTYRDVLPRTSIVTLRTMPSNLKMTLDGQPVEHNKSFVGVAGVIRNIGVPAPQTVNGVTWEFDNWSDGGAREHDVSTPGSDQTYVATFRLATGNVGTGTGLAGTYYDRKDFRGKHFSRRDATINFRWETGEPIPGIEQDTFSVRWAGFLQPQLNESYVIHARADDGVRVWLGTKLIINSWGEGNRKVDSLPITLEAGKKYPFVVDYYDQERTGRIQIQWSSTSLPKSLIPPSQLYGPGSDLPGPWKLAAIGTPFGTGSAVAEGGQVNLNSGGGPATTGSESMHFLYRELTGDGEITVRVLGMQKTSPTTHAGLMIRDSLTADSPYVATNLSHQIGLSLEYRYFAGKPVFSSNADTSAAPIWMRLRKTGNNIEAFKSTDGVNWLSAGSNLIDMDATVFVGLYVQSTSNRYLTTAFFDGLSFS